LKEDSPGLTAIKSSLRSCSLAAAAAAALPAAADMAAAAAAAAAAGSTTRSNANVCTRLPVLPASIMRP